VLVGYWRDQHSGARRAARLRFSSAAAAAAAGSFYRVVSHSHEVQSKRKLLLATSIWVDVASPRVPLRDIRRYVGLEQHFDTTWAFTGTTANKGEHRLPDGVATVFVPQARSKWHFLFALFLRYVKVLADAMRQVDVVLVLGPIELTTLPALVAARLRHRPSLMLMVAPVSALEFFRRPLSRRMASFLLNLEVLLSTETLLINKHLARGVLPSLRRRLNAVLLSPIGEEDFLPIVAPSPDATVELLYVGRLVDFKRVDIAIETVGRLRRDGVDAMLTVVGDGADRAKLTALSAKLGLSSVVHFEGWTEDPARLRTHYGRAFAFLLPSEIEAFGGSVLEAMAAGTPVVRTAPSEGFDVLEPGVDIVVVPSGTAEQFASAVRRLQADRDFYLQIARAAQKKASTLTREAWQSSLCERAQGLIREKRA
jgi:glycosyltransferase involved in cell wall biosynthesis